MEKLICGFKTSEGKVMDCRKRENGKYYDCVECWVFHQVERHGIKFEVLAKEYNFPLREV